MPFVKSSPPLLVAAAGDAHFATSCSILASLSIEIHRPTSFCHLEGRSKSQMSSIHDTVAKHVYTNIDIHLG